PYDRTSTTIPLFFFHDNATTEIYTLSLHDALPICPASATVQSGDFTMDAKTDTTAKTATLTVGNKNYDFPILSGTVGPDVVDIRDRKSTRLNSSHVAISYAVFCLKKKTYTYNRTFK